VTKTESVEALDKQIEELEAEERKIRSDMGDFSALSKGTEAGLLKSRQRLGIIPSLLLAAKGRRLELLHERQQAELSFRKEESRERHEALVAAQEKLRQAEAERDKAQGAWSGTVHALFTLEQAVKQTERTLNELKEAAHA
jgi:hypothetical protein